MDMQSILDGMISKARQETLKTSPQITLGELLLMLEAIQDKTKSVVFDFGNKVPTGLDSWRGSYAELAFTYDESPLHTVSDIIAMLKEAIGRTYEGYKGGDFVMSRHTPIWVANYSESSVSDYKGNDYASVGVIGLVDGERVTLTTSACEF